MTETTLTIEDERAARAARVTGVAHAAEREALVEVGGPDAARYLQAVGTRDVSGLGPGDLRYGAVIDDRARYVADFWIWRAGDAWWLECAVEVRAQLVERLSRYAVADDVEIAPLSGVALFHLEGPAVPALARRLIGAEIGAAGTGVGAPGTGVRAWARRSRYGEEGITLALAADRAPDLQAAWAPMLAEAGLLPASAAAQNSLRLEAGRPLGGVDVTGEHLLPEAGLWGAISLDKGCFPGQEILRRVVTRAELRRRLVGFVETGDAGPAEPPLTVEATSVAGSAALGCRIGMGWIRTAGAGPGMAVRVVAGEPHGTRDALFAGRLVALPLVAGPRFPLPDVVGEPTENTTPR